MFIIHGTRQKKVPLGFVAEYCGTCRVIREHALTEIRLVSHIYFIPLGAGKAQSLSVACCECGRVMQAALGRYRAAASAPGEAMASLIAATNPEAVVIATRMITMHARVEAGSPTPEDLALFVQTWLLNLPEKDWKRGKETHFDLRSTALMVAASSVMVWFFIELGNSNSMGVVEWLLLLVTIGLWVGFGIAIGRTKARYVRDNLEPRLAEALARLKPTPAAIRVGAADALDRGFVLAKHVDGERVVQRVALGA